MPWNRTRRTLKRFYYRFMRLRGTPQQIALGLALGIYVGMTPFLGFHTVIAVMLAALFGWSKISAGIGVFVTNPFTAPFIYPLTYRMGVFVTGFSNPEQWRKIFEPGGVTLVIKESPMIIVDLLVGGAIVGVPLAMVAYYVSHDLLYRTRRRLEKRKARRLTKKAALCKRIKSPRKSKCLSPDKKDTGAHLAGTAPRSHAPGRTPSGDGGSHQGKKIKSNNMIAVGTKAPSRMPMGATSSLK